MSAIESLLASFTEFQLDDEVLNAAERFAEFKRLIPGALPPDYEEFLRQNPKAIGLKENHVLAIDPPRPRQEGVFTYIGPNPPIHTLYGLQEKNYGVLKAFCTFEMQVPPGLIPIAGDLFQNQICMDIAGPAPYTIWHWFIEGEESFDSDGNPGYANMFRLAYNFTDLLQRLRHGEYLDPDAPPAKPAKEGGGICYMAPGVEEDIRKWRERQETNKPK